MTDEYRRATAQRLRNARKLIQSVKEFQTKKNMSAATVKLPVTQDQCECANRKNNSVEPA